MGWEYNESNKKSKKQLKCKTSTSNHGELASLAISLITGIFACFGKFGDSERKQEVIYWKLITQKSDSRNETCTKKKIIFITVISKFGCYITNNGENVSGRNSDDRIEDRK